MSTLEYIPDIVSPWLSIAAHDPALRALQLGMLLTAVVAVFLVFYTLRDVLQRSQSFFFMLFSIVLVSIFPGVGFLLYVLIRPTKTLTERELLSRLEQLKQQLEKKATPAPKKVPAKKAPAKKTSSKKKS